MNARCRYVIVTVLAYAGLHSSAFATWTTPVPLYEVNSDWHEKAPFMSYDGQTLYFSRQNFSDRTRIYQATRDSVIAPLAIEEIGTLGPSASHIDYAWVSPDNLRMYYYIGRIPRELYVTQRSSVDDPWVTGSPIKELNALGGAANPSLTPDELTIYFTGTSIPGGEGGYDLWTAKRSDKDYPFIGVANLIEVNSSANDYHPFITDDGLTLYFASTRLGRSQLFKAMRTSTDVPFGQPEHLSIFDSPGSALYYPFISSDGTTFLFARSYNGGQYDIYVSYIPEPATVLSLGLGTLALRRRPR